ncbi:galectin-4 isoform X6 [Plutella xylostella]|uniref:galectin-4 isoform X6 n=1 Tax=Plutella xylostella TaxID=51655 RepID=UPI002032BD5D|nr:galectin-4 isoform X6 [Plutella xylostella]
MASQPIFNPVIPCVQPIPGGAYPGLMIRIRGSSFPNAERFAINLQCGPNTDPRDDIALHLNVRYDHMCIVRNHLASMSWGPEDVDGAMPIARGQAFEALVLVEPSSFKVAFNGVHFCQFSHRLPFQRVSHLTIDGDVSVQSIGFEGAAPPPQYAPPQQQGYYGAPQQPGAYGGGQSLPEPLPEHKVSIDPPTPEPPSHPTPDPPPANNDFVTMICYRPTLSMVPPTYTKGTFLSYHALAPHPLRALCGACLIVFGYLIHFIMNCLCSCCICFDYNRVTRLSEY